MEDFKSLTTMASEMSRVSATQKTKARPLNPPKSSAYKTSDHEERLPNLQVTDRGHEQIERWARPSFVDEMKDGLVHGSSKPERFTYSLKLKT